MAKQREHGLFGRLIAEALNVPEGDVEQALDVMRNNIRIDNAISVIFRKEKDGWHTYTQYGVDVDIQTTIKFDQHIRNAVDVLNGKVVTDE